MAEQRAFLDRIMAQSNLTAESAQAATKVMFRILRDMLLNEEVDKVAQELREDPSPVDVSVADLWGDPNVMVAFFSRISPLRQLTVGYQAVMLRLEQEGALPEQVKPEKVAMAIFSATKAELSPERIEAIAQALPRDGLRQMWEQA